MEIKDIINRQKEIEEAHAEYPNEELGVAYTLWKRKKGEPPTFLNTAIMDAKREALKQYTERPCTRPGCAGTQFLQAICTGSVEGKAGWNSTWVCSTCWVRELSTKDFSEWIPDAKN